MLAALRQRVQWQPCAPMMLTSTRLAVAGLKDSSKALATPKVALPNNSIDTAGIPASAALAGSMRALDSPV